jgi:GLPGLI family protein
MKTKILLAAVSITAMLQQANAQSITVVYEMQPKMEMKIEGIDQSIVEQIKKQSKKKYQLCYHNGESVYRTLKSESPNLSGNMIINIKTPEDITYRNHNTNKEISYKDFFGKDFLIENELKSGEWTVTDSTKMILDYLCKKAFLRNGDKETVVWFCPNVPIKDGAVYTGLEGIVLEVQSDKFNLTAIEISDEADCKIEIPTKGKKISAKEFEKMVEKRIKAMEKESNRVEGSEGGITIKITK